MFLPSNFCSTVLHSASSSCAIKGIFVKILICHPPNSLRAVTDNLQRLVGVLTAEVDEEKRMSCKQVALTWMEDSDVG